MSRRAPRVILAIFASLLLAMSVAASAQAAVGQYGGYNFDGVNIRESPYTWATSHGLGYTPHTSCNVFYEQGESINGDPWWLWHGNLSTGVQGYSHESFMYYSLPKTQCVF